VPSFTRIKRGGGDGAGYHTSRFAARWWDRGIGGPAHGGRSLRSVRPGTALGALRLAEALGDLAVRSGARRLDCHGSSALRARGLVLAVPVASCLLPDVNGLGGERLLLTGATRLQTSWWRPRAAIAAPSGRWSSCTGRCWCASRARSWARPTPRTWPRRAARRLAQAGRALRREPLSELGHPYRLPPQPAAGATARSECRSSRSATPGTPLTPKAISTSGSVVPLAPRQRAVLHLTVIEGCPTARSAPRSGSARVGARAPHAGAGAGREAVERRTDPCLA